MRVFLKQAVCSSHSEGRLSLPSHPQENGTRRLLDVAETRTHTLSDGSALRVREISQLSSGTMHSCNCGLSFPPHCDGRQPGGPWSVEILVQPPWRAISVTFEAGEAAQGRGPWDSDRSGHV